MFFKGTADGDFSVDKEAQAKVAEEMDSFLADNGGLVMYVQRNLRCARTAPSRRLYRLVYVLTCLRRL